MLEMTYPKIDTLFKREDAGKKKGHIIPGDYSRPEFTAVREWRLSEKVDGTNIRIEYLEKVVN